MVINTEEPTLMWTQLLKQHKKNKVYTGSRAMKWLY